jgi:hypothetical protein
VDSVLEPLLDTVTRHMATVPHPMIESSSNILLGAGFPAVQIEVNRRMLKLGIPEERVPDNYLAMSHAWAARGRWDSAMTWMNRYTTVDDDPGKALEAYGFAAEGVWLGGLTPQQAVSLREAALAATEHLTNDEEASGARALIAWYDGILAVVGRDRNAVARARERVRQSKSARAHYLDRSLVAFDLAVAGERRRAADELYNLEWHCADVPDCSLHHVTSAINRLAAARWLAAEGDLVRAARLLTWHEAGPLWWQVQPAAGPTYLERARIEQARGNAGLAFEYYEQFLQRCDAPVPALQPLVEEARTAQALLAGLEGRS